MKHFSMILVVLCGLNGAVIAQTGALELIQDELFDGFGSYYELFSHRTFAQSEPHTPIITLVVPMIL